MIKTSTEKPPVWDKLEKAFGVKWGSTIVVAYGDTIHHTKPLSPDVLVHEYVHLAQQNGKPEEWYELYLKDPKFRFGQELLAYREQYKFLQSLTNDRNMWAKQAFRLATDLSSEIYGKVIGQREALKLIRM